MTPSPVTGEELRKRPNLRFYKPHLSKRLYGGALPKSVATFWGVCLPLGEELLKLRRRGARKRARQRERSFGEQGLQRSHDLAKVQNPRGGFVPVGATPAGVARRRRGKRPGAVSQTVVLSLSPACFARNDARVARIVLYAGDIDKSRLVKDIGDRRRLVVAYLDRKHTASG